MLVQRFRSSATVRTPLFELFLIPYHRLFLLQPSPISPTKQGYVVPVGSTVQIECYSLNPAIWIRHADEASDSRVLALGVRPIDTAVDLLKYGFMQQVRI